MVGKGLARIVVRLGGDNRGRRLWVVIGIGDDDRRRGPSPASRRRVARKAVASLPGLAPSWLWRASNRVFGNFMNYRQIYFDGRVCFTS